MDIDVENLIGQARGLGLPQADTGDSPERLMEIAREFESIIIHQLLQQMRNAPPWDSDTIRASVID